MNPCLNCGSTPPRTQVLDLGKQPLANGYEQYVGNSVCAPRYPLSVSECPVCHLVQLDERSPEDLFHRDYPFRSGESLTWMDHCRTFADEYAVAGERSLDVGANDGTLVEILRDAGLDAWGIDPAPAAKNWVYRGLMGRSISKDRIFHARFDLITAWNVLAHISDLDDFLVGISDMLTEDGTLVVEVPNWDLSTWTQVYAEHLSYFTENTLVGCLERRGFMVTSVTPQPTHEGSLRAVCVHA